MQKILLSICLLFNLSIKNIVKLKTLINGRLLPINSRINKSKGGSSNEYFESISRLNMLLSGCILMVCWSIMYVEIYRLTKSVWPCVIMHAIEDAVPTVLVTITGIITLTNSSDFWLNLLAGSLLLFYFSELESY